MTSEHATVESAAYRLLPDDQHRQGDDKGAVASCPTQHIKLAPVHEREVRALARLTRRLSADAQNRLYREIRTHVEGEPIR